MNNKLVFLGSVLLFQCIRVSTSSYPPLSTTPSYYPPKKISGHYTDGLQGPLNVDPLLDCGLRMLAWNYSLSLQPQRAPQQTVFDALRLGAECNYTFPSSVLPSMITSLSDHEYLQQKQFASSFQRILTAPNLWYADPVNGNDNNAGSLQAPFRTIQRALEASRSVSTPSSILLRNGTFYISESITFTATDAYLSIASYPGETATISAGVPLGTLSWSAYNTTDTLTGPYTDTTTVDSCVGGPGESSSICSYNGTYTDYTGCANACIVNSTCNAYTWHDANQGVYANMCYFRIDGNWEPEGQSGHISGQKVQLNIWEADISQVPGLSKLPFDTLFMNNRRGIRARFPNGNPELQQTPIGFTQASSWYAPTPPASPPTNIEISSPSRPQDPWFPSFQWGLGGTVASFNPPGSFWGSTNPPAGSQYVVPSGLVYNNGSFSQRVSQWSYPEGGIIHAFHGGRWGDWAFRVKNVVPETNSIFFAYGGWNEARGWGSGAEYYIENIMEEIDVPGEWYVNSSTNKLYVFFNGTSGTPPDPSIELVASQLINVFTFDGSMDEPIVGVSLVNLTFAHTAPTFLLSYEVPSGGDWSFYRGGMVTIEGTVNTTILGCTFWSPGGNGLILSRYNRNALISSNEFAYAGESAIVSAGQTDLIDGTEGNWPANTMISYNLMRELGLYTKQSGGYYHGLSINVSFVGNIIFNIPRAGVNINDGFGGGHLLQNNLIFNSVRETADHGCFNSWDRQPYSYDPLNPSVVLPQLTYITNNYFINNYASTWNIDHDDGSNTYVDTDNLLTWGGFKNYLGFYKKALNNFYVYPDASISKGNAPSLARGYNDKNLDKLTSGGWPNCVMSFGTQAIGVNLSDVWSNNTCIASSGSSNFYRWDNCDPTDPYNGYIPLLANNQLYSGDGSYEFSCGSSKWTNISQVQAAGVETGTVVYSFAPTTSTILNMAYNKLYGETV